MLLNTQNLVAYILQRTWFERFSDLEFFQKETNLVDIEIAGLYVDNPRNNIFQCAISKEKAFIFKQPKFLTSGSTWLIYKENQFYQSFQRQYHTIMPSFSWFDRHYHILVMPYLKPLQMPLFKRNEEVENRKQLHQFATQIAKNLSGFHQNLKLDGSRDKTAFSKRISSFLTPYQDFLHHLKIGYKRPEYLDEKLFSIWKSSPLFQKKIYEFLWDKTVFKPLEDFEDEWLEKSEWLIHGDLKIENIMLEGNRIKFIDFELVSIGNIAWDAASLVDSVLNKPLFKNGTIPQFRYEFVKLFIDSYLSGIQIDRGKFLSDFFKFWAIKKIERYRTLKVITQFDFDSNLIRKLLNNTSLITIAFEQGDTSTKSQSINNEIFNYLENVVTSTKNK